MKLVELIPDWLESLTVTAPWSEEVDEPGSVGEELITALSKHMVEESFLIEKIWYLVLVWHIWLFTYWKVHP